MIVIQPFISIFSMSSTTSGAAVFEYDRDAIRVKARFLTKSDSKSSESSSTAVDSAEIRKFSVDPNLTSYETLRSLLSRAFDLNDDLNESFRISYYCANEWLPMLSDWDLDAAVISASDPCLQLALVKAGQRDKVNLRAFESSSTYGHFTKGRFDCSITILEYGIALMAKNKEQFLPAEG